MSKKKYYSFISHGSSALIVDDIEPCIEMIRSEMQEDHPVGENIDFSFEIVEMTEEEFENLPEWEG